MEIFTENSSDLEDLREDYKNELIMLHATLNKFEGTQQGLGLFGYPQTIAC